MKLNKIKGNSYYIDSPTNIGIYTFKNKSCILIDSGNNSTSAKKIDDVLCSHGLHPKYIINTHSHLDHCGGNTYFKNKYPGCIIYTSEKEKVYMENPQFLPATLFTSNPIKPLAKNYKFFGVDYTVDYGINKINDEKFNILSLKGHSIELIGIITPEKVCYLGDSIFSKDILEKYSLPLLYDVKEEKNTLNYLKGVDADYFVISHGAGVLTKEELLSVIDVNLENIENYEKQIIDLLEQPLTKEDILENLAILNDLDMSFVQYHLNFSAVSSFISYLYDKNLIKYSIEDGKLYYFV